MKDPIMIILSLVLCAFLLNILIKLQDIKKKLDIIYNRNLSYTDDILENIRTFNVHEISLIEEIGEMNKQICKQLKVSDEDQPTIMYICDRRKCEKCSGYENHRCSLTSDIKHAKNFRKDYNGGYVEEE